MSDGVTFLDVTGPIEWACGKTTKFQPYFNLIKPKNEGEAYHSGNAHLNVSNEFILYFSSHCCD